MFMLMQSIFYRRSYPLKFYFIPCQNGSTAIFRRNKWKDEAKYEWGFTSQLDYLKSN